MSFNQTTYFYPKKKVEDTIGAAFNTATSTIDATQLLLIELQLRGVLKGEKPFRLVPQAIAVYLESLDAYNVEIGMTLLEEDIEAIQKESLIQQDIKISDYITDDYLSQIITSQNPTLFTDFMTFLIRDEVVTTDTGLLYLSEADAHNVIVLALRKRLELKKEKYNGIRNGFFASECDVLKSCSRQTYDDHFLFELFMEVFSGMDGDVNDIKFGFLNMLQHKHYVQNKKFGELEVNTPKALLQFYIFCIDKLGLYDYILSQKKGLFGESGDLRSILLDPGLTQGAIGKSEKMKAYEATLKEVLRIVHAIKGGGNEGFNITQRDQILEFQGESLFNTTQIDCLGMSVAMNDKTFELLKKITGEIQYIYVIQGVEDKEGVGDRVAKLISDLEGYGFVIDHSGKDW